MADRHARTLAVNTERPRNRVVLSIPSATTRRPPSAPPVVRDSTWLRAILIGGPALAIAGGIVGIALSPVSGAQYALVGILVPAVIVALLALGTRHALAVYAAVAVLDLEAILAGAILPAGVALAIVVPVVGVALVRDALGPRALIATSLGAAVAATLAFALAVLAGPARALFVGTATPVTIATFGTLVAFALALDLRATRRLRHARDVAEAELAARTRAEAELAHTTDLLGAIVEASPLATQAFDLGRRVTVWSSASERIFGWTADEVIGRPMPAAMVPEDERDSAAERIRRTIAGQAVRGDRVRRLSKDGREVWIEIYGSVLRDRAGRPVGVAGQLADVTERVAIEAQLAHAQRLEAIGRLAGGVAHDFNNTLTAIGGFASLIAEEAGDAAAVREDAAQIGEVVERSRQLTRQLLAFARPATLQPVVVDLGATVAGLVPVLRRLVGDAVHLALLEPAGAMVARVDPGQLEQALVNLVVNARDATPPGGRIEVALRRVRVAAGDVPGDPAATGGFVAVTVADTGTGIAPELADRVFEPFFTTKEAGHGTGLGLAIVADFVRQSGGHVVLESAPGAGTSVEIRLPEVTAGA